MDARPVRQTCVQIRMRLVKLPFHGLCDVHGGGFQLRLIGETRVRFLKASVPLDVNLRRAVDQDFRNGVIGKILFHRRQKQNQKRCILIH